ncbi:MAG: phage tail tape measure protein [Bacteroidaceae bacterium]|nr:phage tail tape measure protein [Bacteroidaceae bacterium]
MAKTNNKDVHRGVVLYLDGKEVMANAKQIRAEMKKVKERIDQMTVGSEEYYRATMRYRELDKILRQHRNQLKAVDVQQQSLLQKGINFFRNYSLQITGAVQALTGVAMQLNRFRKLAAEQEDAAANLKALTGLDDDQIAWLTQQAEILSTTMEKSGLRVRKSATEILEAYMLVGSKKPELLQDKEALNAVTIEAMRLAEAAKMELKDAVAGLTLAMNQYGASASEAARYVNVLAAGSKFGAVGVETQTESIVKAGVAASTAKVPIEQLVGVLEALGEKGIEGNIAGTQLKMFLLKLEAGAKDTRPSVVGLQTALERLSAKGLDAAQMTKMFGLESYTAAQALISSADKVRYYTDAVTGTNTAVEQAAINSETTAAKMAQVRNQLNLTGQELARTLAPIISKTVGWTRKFVMAMPAMIEFLRRYGGTVASLVTTLVLYNTYTAIATRATAAWNTVIAFARTQVTGYKAAMGAYREALTGSTTAQVAMTSAVKGTNIVTQAGVIAVGLLKAAYYALSLQLNMCARTLRMVKAALAESGAGLAIIAIGAVVAALIRHNEKMKEAKRLAEEQRAAERERYKEYNEAAARIRMLRKEADNLTASLSNRQKAIEELQKLAPDYQASISEEGRLLEQNTHKLDEYLERLKASIIMESYKTKMTELLQRQMEAQDSQKEASDNYWSIRQANTLQGYNRNSVTARLLRMLGMEDEGHAGKVLYQANKELEDINLEISETEQRMQELAETWNFSLVNDNHGGNSGGEGEGGSDGGGEAEEEEKRKERVRKALEDIDTRYDARANELKQRFIDGDIATEHEYSAMLQDIEMERLNAKMKVAGLEPKQREELRQRVLDIRLRLLQQLRDMDDSEGSDEERKLQKQLRQNEDMERRKLVVLEQAKAAGLLEEEEYNERKRAILQKRVADDQKAYEQTADNRLKISRKSLDNALLLIRQQRASEHLTEQEYNERILAAKQAFYDEALKDQQLSTEQRQQLEKERNELQLAETERINKQLEDKNRRLFDAYKSLGEEIGSSMAEFFTDSEKDIGDFLKDMVKAVLDAVEKLMTAAIAERTISNIAHLGIAGLAKAAGEIALITAAFETAKAAIGNFSTGGYTGSGQWNEPRGIVHAGEFVANRYAVANDAVRPVLDLIDQAQRNGSIANLKAADIAAAASPSAPAVHTATAPAGPSNRNTPSHDPELTAALHLLTRTTARAAEAYREPSPAYCYLEGRGGINTAQDLLTTMKSNASRKK